MRIAQIVLPGASHYERKSQRIDAALPGTELVEDAAGFDLAHVYGPPTLPPVRIGVPYVANAPITRRWWQRHISQPVSLITPETIPEAVEERAEGRGLRAERTGVSHADPGTPHSALGPRPSALTIGVFVRPSVQNIIDQTMHRLDRTRDDLAWQLFDAPPAPEELAELAVWVDPAVEESDYDGFTAEALVAGRVVIASRTPINLQRTEKGRTALLVPVNDPNELTHAILTALFKPEVGQQRVAAARQTMSKFRPRQRLRALARLYESLIR